MTHPLLLIKPLLSLDSLQKVGFLARPAGGAVEKNGQLVSPVTTISVQIDGIFDIYENAKSQVTSFFGTPRFCAVLICDH